MEFTLKAIAAVSLDGVIGRNGDLPWRLKEDLAWFKKITSGHTVLMGRKTWDSLGRPLPNRRNLVLSRSLEAEEGMEVIRSTEGFQDLGLKGDVFVIGGGEVYSMLLPKCDELYLTKVFRNVEDGDAFFPEYENLFEPMEILAKTEEFEIRKWARKVDQE